MSNVEYTPTNMSGTTLLSVRSEPAVTIIAGDRQSESWTSCARYGVHQKQDREKQLLTMRFLPVPLFLLAT